MERRQAVTAAAAASLTFLLGAAGLTANATILGSAPSNGVGKLAPVAASAVKPASDAVGSPTTAAAPATTAAPTTAPPTTAAPVPAGPAEGASWDDEGEAGRSSVEGSEAPAPRPASTVAPAVSPTAAAPTTSTKASPVASSSDDDEHEREHEAPEAEHEGSQDDD